MTSMASSVLDNGLRLIVEPSDDVASVAVRWMVPCGHAADPDDGVGRSTLLSDLLFRGAGDRSSRELSDAFDALGIRRDSHLTAYHTQLSAVMLGEHLETGLDLLADMVTAPRLDETALDPVRELCLLSLDSLEDDPQHLVMLRLTEQHWPEPFNRHGYGEASALRAATVDALRSLWAARFQPRGSILAIAGRVDPNRIAPWLNERLASWSGQVDEPVPRGSGAGGYRHHVRDTAQVHIGIAWDAPPLAHEQSPRERLATAVLTGSTSGRLFTEVRQKRSLCYSVGGSYRPGRDRGSVTIYTGTTPDHAEEALRVCLDEVRRLTEGVTEAEFARARTQLKSRLIMQGESTSARASTLAADTFRLGRPRPLDEIAAELDDLTLDDVNDYLRERAPGPFTVTTMGPRDLAGVHDEIKAGAAPTGA